MYNIMLCCTYIVVLMGCNIAPGGMAWRGSGAAAPGSFRGCPHSPSFREKIPVVPGGFPARLSVLSRSSALVPPPSKDVYTSQAERRQFFALLPAVGCAVSGSVPLEVGLVRGCSVCSRCSFFCAWLSGAAPRAVHGLRGCLPVCGRKMADKSPRW